MSALLSHEARCARARESLDGLALGDAFGRCFFLPDDLARGSIGRELPVAPWHYTDDTIMSVAVVETLEAHCRVDQDQLAASLARKYSVDPSRGYGGTAHRILREIGEGADWRRVSRAVFDGMGSMGNGGAMRSAPIGGYYCDSPTAAAEEAQRASAITHGHLEGVAGGAAVAAAASHASSGPSMGSELLEVAADLTPDTETRAGFAKALRLPLSYSVKTAAAALGNGERLLSQDTVPFAIWAAARHLDSFEEALWFTVSALGDRDTTCAIVGGILALVPDHRLPEAWLERRESPSTLAGPEA